jgi:hypothetical protein
VAGLSWLAGPLAAAMIAIAVFCAGRLACARRWRRPTEVDADSLHLVMGVAMAGMLMPRLSLLPSRGCEAVFGAAAAWFAWQSVPTGRGIPGTAWRCPHPVPHLVECAAMLYMLLAIPRLQPGSRALPMPGMSGSAAAASFPALAAVLALFMLGYVLWATDQLASLARTRTALPARAAAWDHSGIPVTPGALAAAGTAGAARPTPAPGAAGSRHGHTVHAAALAPRLATCYKIMMGMTMGYMLVMML